MTSEQAIAPSEKAPAASDRPDVFVSYSRKDKAFAGGPLLESLQAAGKDIWMDLQDIPPAADWVDEIDDGIEAARAFVFVLTPESAASAVCRQELSRAVEGNKRLIPVLRREVAAEHVPDELQRLNWILLREEDDFDEQFGRLVDALDVDFEWVDTHARLAVRAREWQRAGEDGSLLLRGSDLASAERWLQAQNEHAETPTPEHGRYIAASRQASARRQRLILGAVIGALAVSIGLTIFAILQAKEAREQRTQAQRQRDRALSLALAANANANGEVDPELSLLLATAALDKSRTAQAHDALREALRTARWRRIIRPPGGRLQASDLSPDARLLVTAGRSSTPTVWDATTGRRLRDLAGHRAGVGSAEFSPDSRRVVTTASDGSARIWDARTGRSLASLPGDRDRRSSSDFDPFADFAAGGRLVYTSGRRFTRVWDLHGRRLAKLRVPGPEFNVDVDVSGDGRRVATTRELADATQVWDVRTGRVLRSLRGDDSSTARFSPDGRRIATGGGIGKPGHIWDVASGRRLHELDAGVVVDAPSFSDDGTRIVATYLDDVYVLDAATGRSLARLRGHGDFVSSAIFSPDGRRVLTASEDGTARIWNARTGRVEEVLRGHTRAVAAADYSSDGRTIATLSEDGTARIWDAVRDTVEMRPPGGAEDAELSADGRLVVPITDEAPVLEVRDAANGRVVKALRVPGTKLGSAHFSPRGDVVAAADLRNRVWLWSTSTWDVRATVQLGDLAKQLAFSRDGRRLLTASFDDTITVTDVAGGRQVARIHAPDVEGAAFDGSGGAIVGVWNDVRETSSGTVWSGRVGSWTLPAGSGPARWPLGRDLYLSEIEAGDDGRQLLVSGGQDALVLDSATHKVVSTIVEPRSESSLLNAAHFSHDGTRVITADDDNVARIWDARTGRHLLDVDGHTGSVADARFSPDGRFAATISNDGTSRVWDSRTGATVQTFEGLLHGTIERVRFTPDGTRLLTADGEALRIFSCELCASVDRQLEMARSLVARKLSKAERRASGLS